ncbi:DUF6174 domain-containing protein [Streptomyces sp. NPDC001984]
MTAVRSASRSVLSFVVLFGGLVCATSACGEEAATAGTETAWEEPSSYSYTLESSEGERALIGTFRITVRDGKVVDAVGLDESGRRVAKDLPDEIPTLGELLKEYEQARSDNADTAKAEYAADGHPVRIELDGEENAIDDEVLYVVSAYEPAGG